MKIPRLILPQIIDRLSTSDKAVVIYGPRQVGKTTLCREVIDHLGLKALTVNADELRYLDVLSSRDHRKLLDFVSNHQLLFLDEAQRIPDIGINLKILIDNAPHLKILVTGSSSFELASTISEPLTGRKWVYSLYPIATCELKALFNPFELNSQIEERLILGSYPQLFQFERFDQKCDYIRQVASDYLYKDLLALHEVRHADKIRKLLKLLAFQIGNEVSLTELGTQVEMSKETVARYLDLLEKTFVLYPLTGFSRNLRKEVSKMNKYYFYDVGVRNSLIDNFKPLSERDDHGALWENFLMMERLKLNHYQRKAVTSYFWRTYTGGEVDYVEEGGGALAGFEFKWGGKKRKHPASWLSHYPQAKYQFIDRENWLNFV